MIFACVFPIQLDEVFFSQYFRRKVIPIVLWDCCSLGWSKFARAIYLKWSKKQWNLGLDYILFTTWIVDLLCKTSYGILGIHTHFVLEIMLSIKVTIVRCRWNFRRKASLFVVGERFKKIRQNFWRALHGLSCKRSRTLELQPKNQSRCRTWFSINKIWP